MFSKSYQEKINEQPKEIEQLKPQVEKLTSELAASQEQVKTLQDAAGAGAAAPASSAPRRPFIHV